MCVTNTHKNTVLQQSTYHEINDFTKYSCDIYIWLFLLIICPRKKILIFYRFIFFARLSIYLYKYLYNELNKSNIILKNTCVLVAQVLEDPTDDGVKSTLIIRNSREEQFGGYNCTASNYYGSDSIEIVLVPKSKCY